MASDPPNTCIVTYPILSSGIVPLTHLSRILSDISGDLSIISGNEANKIDFGRGMYTHIDSKVVKGMAKKSISNLITQIRVLPSVFKSAKRADYYFFTLGGETMVLPMTLCKLLGKKVVIVEAASAHQMLKCMGDRLSIVAYVLERMNMLMSNAIVVYSNRIISLYGIERFKGKTHVSPQNIVEEPFLGAYAPPSGKGNTIGFVGRLSEEKGIQNLVDAVELLGRNDVSFIVIGDGPLGPSIKETISDRGIPNATMTGWVDHGELPGHLSKIRLLVVPSYTEGLPNAVLEAMSCGAIVLGTRVGAMEDVVKDGDTGFLLDDNRPETIASSIDAVLEREDLDEVSFRARALVMENYTLLSSTKRYKELIDGI